MMSNDVAKLAESNVRNGIITALETALQICDQSSSVEEVKNRLATHIAETQAAWADMDAKAPIQRQHSRFPMRMPDGTIVAG